MNNRISDLNFIFSTPIWTTILKNQNEINKKMYNYIHKLKTNDPKGIIRSNLHGWHSKNFKLEDVELKFFINELSPIINESLNDMGWDLEKNEIKITEMWSIINPNNTREVLIRSLEIISNQSVLPEPRFSVFQC